MIVPDEIEDRLLDYYGEKPYLARNLMIFWRLMSEYGYDDLEQVYSTHTMRGYRRMLREAGIEVRPYLRGKGRPKRKW